MLIAIKYNNAAVNGVCPICGGRTDPRIPLALFLCNSYTDVCDQCGKEEAPELVELLDYFYSREAERQKIDPLDPIRTFL